METEVVSSFFSKQLSNDQDGIAEDFLFIVDEVNNSIQNLKLPPTVECVYNPTIYARYTFELYVHKYCNNKKHIMYFGMNPGPWGMSQTGVPFGEVNHVRDWLNIQGPVGKPEHEISPRPVTGFNCRRSEISGKRFWGFFKSICQTPDNFFKTSFVYNYLSQQWMKKNGLNLTPQNFKTSEMEQLFSICDPAFAKVLTLYDVKIIVAIGKFCETRAKHALKKYLPFSSIPIFYMPHPSPRTVNNNNWDEKAIEFMTKNNLLQFYN